MVGERQNALRVSIGRARILGRVDKLVTAGFRARGAWLGALLRPPVPRHICWPSRPLAGWERAAAPSDGRPKA